MLEIDDVVQVIRTDPALTARILKATNSSFYAVRSEVTTIERAVPLLGISAVTSLALGFSLIDQSMTKGRLAEHYQTYWMQSVVQATAAEVLGRRIGPLDKDEAFQTGLLLDIGQLAMLKTIGKECLPVFERSSDWQRDLAEVETEVLGFNHTEIGSKLANKWKLPTVLCWVIAKHHVPIDELLVSGESPDQDLLKLGAMVSAIGDYFCRSTKGLALRQMQEIGQRCFNMSDAALGQMLEQVRQRFEGTAEIFQVPYDGLPSPSDLLAEANVQLSELAIRAQIESAMAVQRQQTVEEEKRLLRQLNQALQHQAFRDPLTGVYNRKYFDEALMREINRCTRDGLPVGILFVDLDHFKQLNDQYGHRCGDMCLQRAGQLMGSLLRDSDLVARYGGEEFVVIVHNPKEDGIINLSERIRGAIAAERLSFGGQTITMTASIGAAMATPDFGESNFADRLVEAADQAMYESKRRGRNQVNLGIMRSLSTHKPPAVPVNANLRCATV
jgi:diguanylate cyclase (GGDEF)-like protein